jgi:hypothetical protein
MGGVEKDRSREKEKKEEKGEDYDGIKRGKEGRGVYHHLQ